MTTPGPHQPDMPPYPFDPLGSAPPYEPEVDDDGPIILTPPPEPPPPVWPNDYPPKMPDRGPRPPWWPEPHVWPPQPEPSVIIEITLSPHIWPRLPPDHPYHLVGMLILVGQYERAAKPKNPHRDFDCRDVARLYLANLDAVNI